MNAFYTAQDHFVLLPAIMLALFGSAILLLDFFVFDLPKFRKGLVWFTLIGLAFTGWALFKQHGPLVSGGYQPITAFQGSIVLDRMSEFFNWILLIASVIVTLISYKFLQVSREPIGEYYGLILLAQSGMFFLVTGADLVTLFIGLETTAVCFYILVGFLRDERRSNEAAIKYLLLGAFSSGFLLYGFSLLYGLSGSTKIGPIADAVAQRGAADPIVLLALITTSVGLLFKISAVPFHMWAPDAYEGAPTPITAYLSVASKAASFAFLLRLFLGPFAAARPVWEPMLMFVAIASLTIGNLAAITQNNVKRMLAYSSISHAGYMLFGLIAGNQTGIHGVGVYILVYTFMNLGAFLVIAAMRREGVPGEDIEDFTGLIHKHPAYAIWMMIFLVSLAGIPPTAGFLGKYYIFLALIETGHYVAAVLGALYAAVALYYYFRITKAMFASEGGDEPVVTSSAGMRTALVLTGAFTLIIGIYPEPFLRFARIAVMGN